ILRKSIVEDCHEVERMSKPWRGSWISNPAIIVQPENVAELQTIMRLCAKNSFPVVPQGGNTGLSGAAICRPGGNEVLLSMKRLNRIRSIDLDDDVVVAEAGCILSSVKDIANDNGRLFPLSLGAQGSCTIGGNIATNAGGMNAIRYGTMRNLVAGVEVVLANGDLWNGLRALRKDNAGYDLKHLFIGSEGTLGIVTAAALRLFPIPHQSVTCVVAVQSPREAFGWYCRLKDEFWDQVNACELIERICIDVAIRHIPQIVDPFPNQYPWYVMSEVISSDKQRGLGNDLVNVFSKSYDEGTVLDGVVAMSTVQAQDLWRMRESIPEAHKLEGLSFKHDISVPTSRVSEFIASASLALVKRFPSIRPFSFGHLGDGNIHFNPLAPENDDADAWQLRLADVNRITHDIATSLGGSISAEHGIGQLRKTELVRYRSQVELSMMKAARHALDPKGLMNPGKVF
ncbi:MAG: FAD-binding oxidoreductase, partial [Nitrospirales bacterium]